MASQNLAGLSAEQARFAREHDAYLGFVLAEANAVMYRDDPGTTHRWVVDPAGHVVQDDAFRSAYSARASV
ncbi:MAG: hypothetical protein QOI03_1492 [Solirubrobacteraceae bacterium]|jgi:hypothetical protein|nr:hypothetical protein [Solirubrobacteraceae bacterium]